MHDGDQKEVVVTGTLTTITHSGNSESWVVSAVFDPRDDVLHESYCHCSAHVYAGSKKVLEVADPDARFALPPCEPLAASRRWGTRPIELLVSAKMRGISTPTCVMVTRSRPTNTCDGVLPMCQKGPDSECGHTDRKRVPHRERALQRSRHVRGDPDCVVLVRLRTHDGA